MAAKYLRSGVGIVSFMRAFMAYHASMRSTSPSGAILTHLISPAGDAVERCLQRRPPQTLGSTSPSRCSRRRRSASCILWHQTTCDASARLATRGGSRGRCRDLNAPPPHRGSGVSFTYVFLCFLLYITYEIVRGHSVCILPKKNVNIGTRSKDWDRPGGAELLYILGPRSGPTGPTGPTLSVGVVLVPN